MEEISKVMKGSLVEIQCITEFMKLGIEVSIPYGNHARYDFIADYNGKLLKVQVKAPCKIIEGESFSIECRTTHTISKKVVHHNYTEDEIDYFATYYNGICYLVPIQQCSSQKTLRLVPPASGRTQGINFAKDYELKEVLKTI